MSLESKNEKLLSEISGGRSEKPNPARRPLGGLGQASVAGSMAGSGLNAAKQRADVAEANLRTKELELDELKKQGLIVALDPKRVRLSKFANRHPRSFDDQDFTSLADSIRSSGGNEVPILVRPITDDPDHDHELAYGSRRRASCEVVGVPVNAIVRTLSDQELLAAMELENEAHKKPSPFEYGMHYSRLLESGQYKSFNDLAIALQVPKTQVFKLAKYGQLAATVVAAFADPREIKVNWVDSLVKAQANESELKERLSGLDGELAANEVYRRLTGATSMNSVVTSKDKVVVARFRTIDGNPALVLTRAAPAGLLDKLREICEQWGEGAPRGSGE